MDPVSAHDVARELRQRLPYAGTVKIHKLLYYAQGWHLAWSEEPLFVEPIEAWANGPVVARLWADEKYDRRRPEPQELDADQLSTIDYIVKRYGGFTGKDLIRATHKESPWLDITESEDEWSTGSGEIEPKELRRFFEQDDSNIAYNASVARLRGLRDPFQPRDRTPDLDAAVGRAVAGVQVRDSRPI